MSLKKLFLILLGIQTVLVICLGIMAIQLFWNEGELSKSRDIHFRSWLLADELRQSSDDLTRMARTYVATGNPEYERQYWTVLDIRNGKIPRPVNYHNIYWDLVIEPGQKPREDGEAMSLHELMINEGFSNAEFDKLNEAQKNSDELVNVERIAMNTVKGLFDGGTDNFTLKKKPDREMAIRLMNDEAYHMTKAGIMKPIGEFYDMFEQRTTNNVIINERKSKNLLLGILVLIIVIIGIFVLSFVLILGQIKKGKQKAEELRLSEDKYRTLMETMSDGVYRSTHEGKFIEVNPAMVRILGYDSKEELLAIDIKSQLYLIEEERESAALEEILEEMAVFRLRKKDGSEIWVEDHGRHVLDNEGNILYHEGSLRDVTDRKHAEDAIRDSEVKLNVILESTGDGILAVDGNGKVIKTNNRFAELWRIPQSLIDSKDDDALIEFVLDQLIDADAFVSKVHQLYNSMEEDLDQLHFKDGRIFERFSAPLSMPDSSLGRVWSFRDITERIQAEKALSESEEMFRQLFNHSADPILLLNESGFTNCNTSTITALGYSSKDEFLDKQPWELSPEKQPDGQLSSIKAELMIRKAIADGYNRFEWIHTKSNGDDFPVEVMLTPIKLKGKQFLYTIWRDISKRKESEKLRNALYDISNAVNQTPDIDSLYQRIHEIVKQLMHANNFYIALYDQETDLISFPYFIDEFDKAGPPVKPGKGCTEYVLRTGEPVIIDNILSEELNLKGEINLIGAPSDVWLGVPLKISDKTIGVMVVQDYKNSNAYSENEKKILVFVSNQIAAAIYKKRTEEKLKNYTDELIEINASKDKVFSIIAHDLRSPFNSLIGFSDILMEGDNTMTQSELTKIYTHINKTSKTTYNLLENLLEWSRSMTGRIVLAPENHNVINIVNECVSVLRGSAEKKGIQIVIDIDYNDRVYADKNTINTVIRNLLSNAIKFTKKDGYVKITSLQTETNYQIGIRDTGVGIEKDNLKKLFSIKHNYTVKGTANEAGSGLGLILCKDLVTMNKGELSVESELGKGSVFTITLPINL